MIVGTRDTNIAVTAEIIRTAIVSFIDVVAHAIKNNSCSPSAVVTVTPGTVTSAAIKVFSHTNRPFASTAFVNMASVISSTVVSVADSGGINDGPEPEIDLTVLGSDFRCWCLYKNISLCGLRHKASGDTHFVLLVFCCNGSC